MPSKDQPNVLLFNKWDVRKIEVRDPGLHNVISLNPSVVIPITFGRHEHQRMKKAEVHIVERLANKLLHFGKRYAKNTGRMGGKKARIFKT
ncbi:MAG: 30S ribosomal protein S7, partial [Nitrososphaeraceae archaeon]